MVLSLTFQNVGDCCSNKGYFEKENRTAATSQPTWKRAPSPGGRDAALGHRCLSRPTLPPVGRVFLSWMGMRFCPLLLGGVFWDDFMVVLFYHVDTAHYVDFAVLNHIWILRPTYLLVTKDAARTMPLASGSGVRWGCTHGGACVFLAWLIL